MMPVLEDSQSAQLTERTANFDRLARFYRWMEWLSFGPWLWWCRTAFLGEMRGARRALTFGDGDGRFTARLLEVNAAVHVDAVDGSAAMLARLKRTAGGDAGRVQTTLADAREWGSDSAGAGGYDLVYTHFFLDCLTDAEVRRFAQRVAACLEQGGIWVVSEFAIPEKGAGRWLALPVVGFLYRAFGILTGLAVRRLPDYHAALREAGLRMQRERRWLGGLLVSECWVHCAAPKQGQGRMLQSC